MAVVNGGARKVSRRGGYQPVRIKRLDVLRAVAVILVLICHGEISAVFTRTGWVGVDLFFVLSGFLISGLLYSEYKKRGAINYPRFFIRRGLKIYPAFFIMILVTFLARQIIGLPNPGAAYLRELLFVQNYKIGIWQHTWSLGVEEHFYIFLPILLLALIAWSGNRRDPFQKIPLIFGCIAVICMVLRAATIHFTDPARFIPPMVTGPSHERIDSLFFGVFLGYLYHYQPEALAKWMARPWLSLAIGALSAIFLSTCFIFDRSSHFLLVFGLTFLYLGFGGLILLSLHVRDVLPPQLARPLALFGTALAFIGTYSYSIYLWHIPFQAFAAGTIRRVLHIEFSRAQGLWFYFAGSVVFGILMARLIEFPVLKLRDKLFPSPQLTTNPDFNGTERASGMPEIRVQP
jgi:peptidoglycan/LPS O-acetylase OafA/YrhL